MDSHYAEPRYEAEKQTTLAYFYLPALYLNRKEQLHVGVCICVYVCVIRMHSCHRRRQSWQLLWWREAFLHVCGGEMASTCRLRHEHNNLDDNDRALIHAQYSSRTLQMWFQPSPYYFSYCSVLWTEKMKADKSSWHRYFWDSSEMWKPLAVQLVITVLKYCTTRAWLLHRGGDEAGQQVCWL